MKKVLGLDLGTTSIGWALVNESESRDERSSIIKLGVRVNPLSVDEINNFEKGKTITTNSDRTLKRGMRRNLQRYKLRRSRLIDIFKREGWISGDSILSEDGKNSTFNTIRLRSEAAESEISLQDLARVLININKNRGYRSNRKTDNAVESAPEAGISLAKELKDKGITPGQYVHSKIKSGEKFIIPQFFQSDLTDEMDKIWKVQQQFYPELTDSLKSEIEGCNKGKTWTVCAKHLDVQGIKRTTKRGLEQKQENYKWRAQSASEKIGLEELVIVFQEIRAAICSAQSYLGEIRERSKELEVNNITVGQLNARTLEENPHANLRNKPFYRNDYIAEFKRIWSVQSGFHHELTEALKKEIQAEMFYQRPLKSQKALVSLCELENWKIDISENGKTKSRTIGYRVAPKSSPVFQEFRIWQRLNDLTVDGEPLLQSEKNRLYKELNCKESLKDSEIINLLKLHKSSHLNFKKIDGNKTLEKLYRAYIDIAGMNGYDTERIEKLPSTEIMSFVDSVFENSGYNRSVLSFNWRDGDSLEDNPLYKLWHLLYSFEGDSTASGCGRLVSKIAAMLNMEEECAARIAQVIFESDYANLCTRAMTRILPHMRDGRQYSEACMMAGYNHSSHSMTKSQLESRTLNDHLAPIPKNSLRNPVVEKILNQMANVVNEVIDRYGKPDEVRIEMARELKQNAVERAKATSDISTAAKRTEEIARILRTEFNIPQPSRNDIIRYRLYEELKDNGYRTLYSDTYIPKEKIFSKEFDIEHIIPKAKLFDDSFANKTLETREVNIKKGDLTAIDFVKREYGNDSKRCEKEFTNKVKDLYSRQIISRSKMTKLLTTEESIPTDFIARDLKNTQYISKKAIEMLEETVGTVTPTIGAITSKLRSDWQLINLFTDINCVNIGQDSPEGKKQGKRTDHRHHAMDALTIAFTKRGIIKYLNTLNASTDEKADIVAKDLRSYGRFIPPMPINEFRAEAKQALESILISIKSKNKVVTKNTNISKKGSGVNRVVQLTPRGQIHKETIYGTSKRYVTKDVKVGKKLDIETIMTVASPKIKDALLERIKLFGGDPVKAFTGRNSIDKNPIWLDDMHMTQVPAIVKTVRLEECHTSRKDISPDIKIDSVIDAGIREILTARLEEYGNDRKKAFSSLDENPIWLNREKGIAIKKVSVWDNGNYTPVRVAKDKDGLIIRDSFGRPKESDFVDLRNNHHVAIFEDKDGHLQEHIVSMYEALSRATGGLSIVDKSFNSENGWKFLFTLKSNEYFVFPNECSGFNPEEIDLKDTANLSAISPNLYRVQKLSSRDYWFRNHLDTSVNENNELKNITWKRITALDNLKGIVKVRVNRLGEIVDIGEY